MTDKIAYEDELKKKYNCKFFKTVRKRENPIKYYFQIHKIFSTVAANYDCLWFNVNNLVNIDCLKLANKYHIKKIIVHSHNSQIMEEGIQGKIKNWLHAKHKKNIDNYATDFWTCSSEAADWLFPKQISSKVYLVKNAIDIDKTSFSQIKREQIRKQYNLDENYVIGNVGRLHFQKNQMFMLSIVAALKSQKINVKLVLVGNGPDKEKLKDKAKELKIIDNVLFVGMQHDMQAWYSSFDLFLFPSLFEGLSVALLEAQSNGVAAIVSTNVPTNVKLNNNVKFLSLKSDSDIWARTIESNIGKNNRLEKEKIRTNFDLSGYNIEVAADKLEKKFLTY